MILAEFIQIRASPMAANFDATLQRFNFIEYAIVRGGKSEENMHLCFRLFDFLEYFFSEAA